MDGWGARTAPANKDGEPKRCFEFLKRSLCTQMQNWCLNPGVESHLPAIFSTRPTPSPHQLRGPFVCTPELRMGWGTGGEWTCGSCCAPFGRPQVEGSDVRDKSDFFLLQQGLNEVQAAPPPRGITCVNLRYAVPRTLGVPDWGQAGSGGSWVDDCSLHSGAMEAECILCHRAGPCRNFICPVLGPNVVVVWAIGGLLGPCGSRGHGAALLAPGGDRR